MSHSSLPLLRRPPFLVVGFWLAASTTLLVLTSSIAHAGDSRLQGQSSASENPACALLTAAEIRNATGFPGYSEPSPADPPGQGAGGGASCQYSAPVFGGGKGPLLSLVLIVGKNYTKTVPIGRGCKKEPVPGVGEEAFFEVCPTPRADRTPPLYVKAGARDLILQMDIEAPDTAATIRPKVIAVAKAAAAKPQ